MASNTKAVVREREVLQAMADMLRDFSGTYSREQTFPWIFPRDIGGRFGTHHAHTLYRLAKRGLVNRRRHEPGHVWFVYQLNRAGLNALSPLKRKD